MPAVGAIILILKLAVVAVTLLLAASLFCLYRKMPRWHGRINLVVFTLTLAALIGLDFLARFLMYEQFDRFFEERQAWPQLYIHLAFSIPTTILLPVMLITGLRGLQPLHYRLGWLFLLLWGGTFVTGVFLLPHS